MVQHDAGIDDNGMLTESFFGEISHREREGTVGMITSREIFSQNIMPSLVLVRRCLSLPLSSLFL